MTESLVNDGGQFFAQSSVDKSEESDCRNIPFGNEFFHEDLLDHKRITVWELAGPGTGKYVNFMNR